MDKIEKKSVFSRLKPATDVEMADSSSDSIVKLGKVSSSIFNRLGGYDEVKKKVEKQSISFSGILKNSPIKQVKIFCLTFLLNVSDKYFRVQKVL